MKKTIGLFFLSIERNDSPLVYKEAEERSGSVSRVEK